MEKISAGRIIMSSKDVRNLYGSGSAGVCKVMRIGCVDQELCMEGRYGKYKAVGASLKGKRRF
jgi:hypothetical protein